MRSIINSLTATILVCLLLSASAPAQKINYDFVPGTDFSKYKTYRWRRADKAMYPDEENDKMLMRSIDTELALKGLTKTETDLADLYVIYQIAIFDDMEWSSFRTDIGWHSIGADSPAGFRGATTNTFTLMKRGSLILDIYDVTQKKRVWQAHATKTVDPAAPLNKRVKNTQKVMAKIFKNYPPPAR